MFCLLKNNIRIFFRDINFKSVIQFEVERKISTIFIGRFY